MASEINVDKIIPQSGTTLELGDSGDTINVTGTLDGSGLTGLSATQLTTGTVPDARFPATLPAASGANLTNLTSANLTGALPAIDGSALTGISAGSVNLTAGANITLGDILEVTSSGTVKPVLNDGPLNSNELTVSSSQAQGEVRVTILEDNKYFAVYSDNGSTAIKGVIITNTNGTISLGTPVTVKSATYTTAQKLRLITLSSSLVVLGDGQANGPLMFTAISISGSTISAGTPVAGYSGGSSPEFDICKLDTSKFFLAYAEGTASSVSPKFYVGSVSGTSVSFGSEYDQGTAQQYPHAGSIRCTAIDSTHVFFGWTRWSSYTAWGSFVTTSGTSISAQTTLSELDSSSSHFHQAGFKLDSNNIACAIYVGAITQKFFLIPIDYTTGATVSQTLSYSSECGDLTHFGGGVDSSGNITFGYRSAQSDTSNQLRMGTVTYDPTIAVNKLIANPILKLTADTFVTAGANALNGTGIIIGRDDTNTDVTAFAFNPDRIETVNRFIGVAGETFTNTNSGKVVHMGGVVEGLSGLTIGKNYYVNLADGSLSSTVSDFPVGKAISASKLLVTEVGVHN